MIKQDELIQDRYRVIRLLGSGGFGAVYLAEDIRLGRSVAIKEMDVDRLGPEERPIAEELFEREARMLAALDHPGLTRIWDYFQLGRRAFLVMEYVNGVTLRELLNKRGGPLDEPFVLECALQLCEVLQYLHTRQPQIIFRDLKPANVMVVEQPLDLQSAEPPEKPAFRLIDFGIARLFKPEQAGDTLIIGTPGYAPPEQYGQSQTDQRSDIYSLGATLHNLLSGQPPLSVPPPPLNSINPAVSPALARAVARATAPDPADRYQSVEALRHDLLEINGVTPAPPPVPPQIANRSSDPRPPYSPGSKATSQLPLPSRTPAPPQQSPSLPMIAIVLVVLAVVIVGALGTRAFNRLSDPPGENGASDPGPRPTSAPAAREWQLPGALGKIAFGQRAGNGFNVWAATLDGQPPKQLTNDRLSYSPAWSPDGARLSITRDRDIYIGTPDNPQAERLDLPGMAARYPAWSPDGRRLAMATSKDGERSWQLTIVDLESRQITFPAGAQNIGGLSWAPGERIAFAARPAAGQPQDIFVLDGGSARNLTNTPQVEEDLPAWSPDGRRLAFAASPPDNLPQRQIVAIDGDGGGRAALTAGPGPHTNPVWSPDGEWIAYLAQENSPDWQVWAMRADGAAPRVLSFGPERKFYLSWGK